MLEVLQWIAYVSLAIWACRVICHPSDRDVPAFPLAEAQIDTFEADSIPNP